MSQYDREGPGIKISGRNQWELSDEFLRDLGKGRKTTSSEAVSMPAGDVFSMDDLTELFQAGSPTPEQVEAYFEKHPNAKIVVPGGYVTANGFRATE